MVLTTFDVPGDGPTRATMAHAWAAAPTVPSCGAWPPGHTVLAGSLAALGAPALWGARALNVALGTASVPLLWSVAAATWGAAAALPAAAALALLPLHAELSATSLTETSFLFALLLGWRLLLAAAGAQAAVAQWLTLLAGGLCTMVAQTIRYEGWVFPPLLVLWWLIRTRHIGQTLVLTATTLAFPVAWTVGNARCGDPWMGFHAALQEPQAGDGYSAWHAARHLVATSSMELGTVLAAAVALGLLIELWRACTRRCTVDEMLALGLGATAWIVLERSTISRGASAWNRYAITALVLALPFAFVPMQLLPGRRRLLASVLTALPVAAMVLGGASGARPLRWLTTRAPEDARRLAQWLSDPARADRIVVSTPVGWELTYLPLYLPDVGSRFVTVSSWLPDDAVARALRNAYASGAFLLVTRVGDEEDLGRIRRLTPRPLELRAPIFHAGDLRVHEVGGDRRQRQTSNAESASSPRTGLRTPSSSTRRRGAGGGSTTPRSSPARSRKKLRVAVSPASASCASSTVAAVQVVCSPSGQRMRSGCVVPVQ
ncbi:MAG: hypothetical protein AB1689_00455 [Thermodesulfobacteriota bacterium]